MEIEEERVSSSQKERNVGIPWVVVVVVVGLGVLLKNKQGKTRWGESKLGNLERTYFLIT